MTSFQGTDTSFSSIDGIQLFLHLTSFQELDYASGLNWDTLQNYKEKGINPYDIKPLPIPPKTTVTIYDVIKKDPNLSKFCSLVNDSGLVSLLDNSVGALGYDSEKLTLFVPTNDNFDLISQSLNLFRPYLTPKDIVKNHLVGIPLYWDEIKDRKNRIYSLYNHKSDNSIAYVLDGKNQIIVNQRTMNMNIYGIFNTCRIINYIETNNGNIYIIDKPIVPYMTS